jgi:hypothetical protein
MRRLKLGGSRSVLSLVLPFLMAGCATISTYDPTSYKNATDLKAESLLLIQKSTDPASQHNAEINKVRIELQQNYEYERGKGKLNGPTVQQWQLLADPDGNLLAGLLKRWEGQEKGFLPAFVDGVSKNIGDAFDEIIRLEQHKVKQ